MNIFENFDLTGYNSYGIKAHCRIAYFPDNEEDILIFFKENPEFVLLGSGHNIILSKSYYEKPLAIFNGNYNSIRIVEEGVLEVEAGAMMWDVARFALDNALAGVEIFYDIPSSLGGAVVMNAGASGEEIKDVLIKVRYLDLKDLQIKEISREEMSFEYRNSFFQRNVDKIVLKAWLRLQKGEKSQIREKMERVKAQRWQKQPKDLPNAGSVFKRPPGYFVGTMIEELNLKGLKVGGAQISEKHGGFIVNYNGEASGEDIINLIEIIKRKVRECKSIELETEQRIV